MKLRYDCSCPATHFILLWLHVTFFEWLVLAKREAMDSSPILEPVASSNTASMPPLPPGPGPSLPPPVAQLLYREGDAWTAVLSLHSSVVQNIQSLSASMASESCVDIDSERDLQYCTALSQAAAQCDALHSELVKLRTLRKARSSFDTSILQPIFSAHSREATATASSLASQAHISLQGVTSDLRSSIQEMKRTEAELTTLCELMKQCPVGSIPCDLRVTVAVGDGSKRLTLSEFVQVLKKHYNEGSKSLEMNALIESEPVFSNESSKIVSMQAVRRQGDRKR